MEKYTKGNEHRTDCDDYEEIRQLYDQINDAGGMVRELKMPKGFLAAVGDIQDYREALGLNPDDEVTEITQDMIDGLPPVLLFAFPGSGETRTEAIRDGMRGWQDSKEI
jgi:hypothetical protein